MIAGLPMYDLPGVRAATDRLWQAIRTEIGPEAPEALSRDRPLWDLWQSPDLLLAQTCGLPYRARLHGRVTLVATPDHGLPDCPPGHYVSTVIRRKDDRRSLDDLARGTMAINDPLSQSGWAAPAAHLAARGLAPARILRTGTHLDSIGAVLGGLADFAAIDCVTLTIWAAGHAEEMSLLDAFERTTPTPALPFITALGRDPAPLARALDAAIAALDEADRIALCLHGLTRLPPEAYTCLPLPPPPPGAPDPQAVA